MRILAIGFTGAALTLSLVAPTWAQGSGTKTPLAATAPSSPTAGGNACATRHKGRKGSGASSDNQANTLNAQELARLQGGAPAPAPMAPAPAPMAPGGNNPTSGTGGPFYQR